MGGIVVLTEAKEYDGTTGGAREELCISARGSEFSRREGADNASCFLFSDCCCGFCFSFFCLSRNEKVGFRGLTCGGVSWRTGGGDDGGVIVLVPSSSCDSREKMVLFLRDGEEDSAATLVSRMARSRLSSISNTIKVEFSLLGAVC